MIRRLLIPLLGLALVLLAPQAPAQAATKLPKKFTIVGSGAGHGVGMSQYGAYQLALNGSTADQILTHYYPGTSVGTAVNNPRTVKVQVFGAATDKRTKTTLKIKGGGYTVTDAAGKLLGTYKAGTATLAIKGSKVTAKIKGKTIKASPLILTPIGNGVVTIAGAHGSYHYGNLQATVIKKRLNIVNQVVMNTEYLYGLDEMPASWGNKGGAAALKAQAIAARNYIIKQAVKGTSGACDCDIFDDERSQNYIGWKKAGPSANRAWIDAVNSTVAGATVQMLRDPQQGFAETPYFASTGKNAGTGSNYDVFGQPQLSYLISQPDPYSTSAPRNPHLSWSRSITQKQAAKIFGVTKITTITITERYPGGLVKTLTATTASGKKKTVTKTAKGWMDALGVPAPWLTVFTAK